MKTMLSFFFPLAGLILRPVNHILVIISEIFFHLVVHKSGHVDVKLFDTTTATAKTEEPFTVEEIYLS